MEDNFNTGLTTYKDIEGNDLTEEQYRELQEKGLCRKSDLAEEAYPGGNISGEEIKQ